ncbi:hypothetical protein BCD67_17415 [Oscillatoriales cyanobacterium USR001]|nr:hypothetical protein BCD67_17415 [Oscillatoriales cyanobacterium USR001]
MSQNNEALGIFLGFVLILVMHSLVLSALIFASPYLPFFNRNYNFFLIPAFIGLWQNIYVIPLIFLARKDRRFGVMKGVIVCAIITALVNGGCWLLLLPR